MTICTSLSLLLLPAGLAETVHEKGRAFLLYDCYRFQRGVSHHEGIGSMFREMRGIAYIAFWLGLEPIFLPPQVGHGGDYKTTRDYFNFHEMLAATTSDSKLSEALLAIGNASVGGTVGTVMKNGTSADIIVDKWMQIVNAENESEAADSPTAAPWELSRIEHIDLRKAQHHPSARRLHELLQDSAWSRKCIPVAAKEKCLNDMFTKLFGQPASVTNAMQKIKAVRAARDKGKMGILVIESAGCPPLYWDKPSGNGWEAVGLRNWIVGENGTRSEQRSEFFKNSAHNITISVHIRAGDHLSKIAFSEEKPSAEADYLVPVSRNGEEIFRMLQRTPELELLGGDFSMLRNEFINRCAIDWNFGYYGTRETVEPPCLKGRSIRSDAKLQYPVKYYLKVLHGLFASIPELDKARKLGALEIHVFSDSPTEWLRPSFEKAYPGLAIIHGYGDGTGLLTTLDTSRSQGVMISELDQLIFSNILLIGEGNFGRWLGWLRNGVETNQGRRLLLQPPCRRAQHVRGTTVVDVSTDGEFKGQDVLAKWERQKAPSERHSNEFQKNSATEL